MKDLETEIMMQCIETAVAMVTTSTMIVAIASLVVAQPVQHEVHKILASDAGRWDRFGSAVGISGTIAAVGAPRNGDRGTYTGSAYLFDIRTGAEVAKLLAADTQAGDSFGLSVACDGPRVIIGAIGADGITANAGAAYVFDTATAEQVVRLTASDGRDSDQFGCAVSISGGTAMVGAIYADCRVSSEGAAYLFDVDTGVQLDKLFAPDGRGSDLLGLAVAVDGELAIAGAPNHFDSAPSSGAAYLFDINHGQPPTKLIRHDRAFDDHFGEAVDIDGTIALVGSPEDDDQGTSSGSAYLFDATTGLELAKLMPIDGHDEDLFGSSVAISGNLAVIGAPGDDDNGEDSGAAYVFDVSGRYQRVKLLASEGTTGDRFGTSVAIEGFNVIVGAAHDDMHGFESGSAYLFSLSPPCLDLSVTNLRAGDTAQFTIQDGTPGRRAIVVAGYSLGESTLDDHRGYCATFIIDNLARPSIVGGIDLRFDANGEIVFEQPVPTRSLGLHVYFQAAMQGTCPEECVSGLVEMTVQ